jgi:hypothetical protein
MVHMSRAYLTEKQMPRTFWYFTIKHAARMMNMIPGRYNHKLASPFMLVHGVRPDPITWLPIVSICFFTTRKRVTPHVLRPKPTHLMALFSGVHLRLMPFWYTIPATNDTTSWIATKLILIVYPPQSILLSCTTAAFLSRSTAGRLRRSVNRIPLVLG